MVVLNITSDILNRIEQFQTIDMNELDTDDVILIDDTPMLINKDPKFKLINIYSNEIIELNESDLNPYKSFKYVGFKDGCEYEIIEG